MICNPNGASTVVSLSFVDASGTILYVKDYFVQGNGSNQISLGTYKLIGFTVVYEYGETVSQDLFTSYSGNMTISHTGSSVQTYNFHGITGSVTGNKVSCLNTRKRLDSNVQ